MKLFEAIHPDLFSVLASPNKELYASALEVLYEAYRDHLRIPENTLYSMLRGKLERQLSEASFVGEDIDEDELRDVSGRARFLMRKLCSKGWFEKERGKDFKEKVIVALSFSQNLSFGFYSKRACCHCPTCRSISYISSRSRMDRVRSCRFLLREPAH